VLQDVIDAAAAQGVGPGFPVFQDALNAFKAANLARFSGVSSKDGHFEIKNVPPGPYIVHLDKEGFVDPAATSNPVRVVVASATVTSIEVSMQPGGVVSGRVRDTSGKPLPNLDVQAVSRTYQNGYPFLQVSVTKQTDDQGEFRLFWLQPGDYYIAAAIRPTGAPAALQRRAYHPNTMDVNNATLLTIKAGDQRPAIDIQLHDEPLYTMSGLLSTTIPPNDTAAMAALLNPRRMGQPALLLTHSDPNSPEAPRDVGTAVLNPVSGKFETIGLIPGTYELYARIPESNLNGGAGLAWAHIPVDLRKGNVEGLTITVHPSVNVQGVATVDGHAPPQGVALRIALMPTGSNVKIGVYNSVGQRPVTAGSDGKFTIIGVPPGLWRVDLGPGLPPNLYIADVRQGPLSVFDDGLEVGSKQPDPLEVQFKSGAGTVEGIVQDNTDKPVAGATVVLAPSQARRENRALYQTATADANGRFTIRSVAPGDFLLFAWGHPVPGGAYFNHAFLSQYEDRGRVVHVSQGSTATQEVTVIP
jgi:protocatechuate 3,4-dioxygenase beta subunit